MFPYLMVILSRMSFFALHVSINKMPPQCLSLLKTNKQKQQSPWMSFQYSAVWVIKNCVALHEAFTFMRSKSKMHVNDRRNIYEHKRNPNKEYYVPGVNYNCLLLQYFV